MAKMYFYYSSMNAGKSTALLQSSYNYRERGMNTLVLAPEFDNRYGAGKVTSRIGIESEATTFRPEDDLLAVVEKRGKDDPVHCVLIDEAQFLTKEQVFQLGEVTDKLNIPVLAYALRTDFQGELFEGSQHRQGVVAYQELSQCLLRRCVQHFGNQLAQTSALGGQCVTD